MNRIYCLTTILLITFLSCKSQKTETKEKSSAKTEKQISFNIEGYYFPKDTIKFKEIRIENILFSTEEKIDESNSNIVDEVYLNIWDSRMGKETILKSKTFKLINRKISLTVNIPDIGDFSLKGTFLGENGPMNDNIREGETIVMKGIIEIGGDFKKETDFTYFGGD